MCDAPEKVWKGKDGIELRRMANPGGIPVLLLHGGGARHQTFLIPARDVNGKTERGLAGWLWDQGFEPWLLDWRAGTTVVDKAGKDLVRARFDLDHAAKFKESDIPFALRTIQEKRPDAERIGAVGHCLGAAALAQAIASGGTDPDWRRQLTHVVLLTLGLFYETPLESRLKSQDRALERTWHACPDADRIDPRPPAAWPDQVVRWPGELEDMYQNWPHALYPHPEERPSRVHELCNRASFMYGTPYLERKLAPEIHSDTWTLSFDSGKAAPLPGEVIEGKESKAKGTLAEITLASPTWSEGKAAGVLRLIDEGGGEFRPRERLLVGGTEIASCTGAKWQEAELPLQFGAIPLRMFRQIASNVRRRWAAEYAEYDQRRDDTTLVGEDSRRRFDGLAVTLITGARNQLWSADSIHRMYEWLTRGSNRPGDACQKVILKEYAHQDLLWGSSARDDVFPEIGKGLGR